MRSRTGLGYRWVTQGHAAPRRHQAMPVLRWLGAWLARCTERSRERQRLRELDDHLVKDIGLSRADVDQECGRWPWDGARHRGWHRLSDP